jgi:hypothetical protein
VQNYTDTDNRLKNIPLTHINKMLHINKASKTDRLLQLETRRLPLCIHCKHYANKVCTNYTKVNLVNGQEMRVLAFDARNTIELCGPGGSYFAPVKAMTKKTTLISDPPDSLPQD